MTYLITYDIISDKVRTKVSKLLLKNGLERIQYSVFVGPLSATEKQNLEENIEKLVAKEKEYNLLLIPLHEDMLRGVTEISQQALDWEYLKGEKVIMIL